MTNSLMDRRCIALAIAIDPPTNENGAARLDWYKEALLEAKRLHNEIKQLRTENTKLKAQQDKLGFDFPDQMYHPTFGMICRRDETLLEAIKRWYRESDNAQCELMNRIIKLRTEIKHLKTRLEQRN